jgi:hypothetical protein
MNISQRRADTMTELYHQDYRTDNEQQLVEDWLILKAKEIPDLNFSLADPADVEQMACLLIAILNIYFSKILLPLKFRPFIFALAGASAGCPKDEDGWFYLRDRELAIQLMDEEGKSVGALKQRIKRLRSDLEAFQIKNNVRLVIIDQGYSDPIKNDKGEIAKSLFGDKLAKGKPSRYRLNVLTVALEVIREHQSNPKSRTEINNMAKELKGRLIGWYVSPDSAGRKDPDKQRRRSWSLALSNMKKVIQFAREDDEDPVVFLMTLVKTASEEFLQPDDRVDQWLREQVLQGRDGPTN